MIAGMAERWFPGFVPRSDWESGFVEALRSEASNWLGVASDAATAFSWHPLALAIDVPERPSRSLIVEAWRVGIEAKQAHLFGPDTVTLRGPTVFGYWDEGRFDDDFDPRDPETLVIQGVRGSAEQFGHWAGEWVGAQLRRPLALLEWESGLRRWVFEDTGWIARQEGRSSRRNPPRVEDAHREPLRNGESG
jgi:hypothetical protein